MAFRVLKCGGTALCAPGGIANLAAEIARSHAPMGGSGKTRIVLVVSALEGETDRLIELAKLAAEGGNAYIAPLEALHARHEQFIVTVVPDAARGAARSQLTRLHQDLSDVLHGVSLVRDLSPKTLDFIMSFGERLSAGIVTEYFRAKYAEVQIVDSRQLLVTDHGFGAAKVDQQRSQERIAAHFAASTAAISIVTGFIGATPEGDTTTIGRGGSDFTAALIGAALNAPEIELWTTVDGVMTADPRKVPKAITIAQLTYEEAMELCHFGAKIIHPPAMQPALDKLIPIRIKNLLSPTRPGSRVSEEQLPSSYQITGVSSISAIALFQLHGTGLIGVAGAAARLFDALSKASVNIILISQASSEHSICFATAPEVAERARRAVEEEFALEHAAHQVRVTGSVAEHAIVAVVGANMRNTPGISGKLFQALGKNGINVAAIAQGSSELNISVVVPKNDEKKALRALHDAFILSDVKTINLFVAGLGLVGSALLEQIGAQQPVFKERSLDLQIIGLTNSRKMRIDPQGIPISEWRASLERTPSKADIARFVDEMKQLNLPNTIFIDCTASSDVAAHYEGILSSSISIVTPNKRANSGSIADYRSFKRRAARANVKFFYETNVGAGLPVIGTLNDLIASGDEIIRIEAVLSGTLSYIFNSFKKGTTFSEIVRDAKAKGYTEPDPRDDLSGTDVARKLLILAREMGLELELPDIVVQSLVPEDCRSAKSVEEFFERLVRNDGSFETLRSQAEARGHTLRYIAKIEAGAARVALESVSTDHPFYSLSGSDNIISFVTKRYFERPLVVKGPGAGTDVTAAGVLADTLRAASYLV